MDWKNVLGSIAPVLAGALGGGPIGAAAVKILADKLLGRPEASEDELIDALSSGSLTGDQIVLIKQAEQSFLLEMERIDAAREQASMLDIQSARQQTVSLAQADSNIAWAPVIISAIIVIGFFSCVVLLLLTQREWDANTTSLLNVLFGALIPAFASVYAYWLGSSAGSKRSGDALRKFVDKQPPSSM